jgi:hypothetical protein
MRRQRRRKKRGGSVELCRGVVGRRMVVCSLRQAGFREAVSGSRQEFVEEVVNLFPFLAIPQVVLRDYQKVILTLSNTVRTFKARFEPPLLPSHFHLPNDLTSPSPAELIPGTRRRTRQALATSGDGHRRSGMLSGTGMSVVEDSDKKLDEGMAEGVGAGAESQRERRRRAWWRWEGPRIQSCGNRSFSRRGGGGQRP